MVPYLVAVVNNYFQSCTDMKYSNKRFHFSYISNITICVFLWVYNYIFKFSSKVLDVWIGLLNNCCKHFVCNKQTKSFNWISYLFCSSSWSRFMFFYILVWGSSDRSTLFCCGQIHYKLSFCGRIMKSNRFLGW